jgi:hypothetical protein
MNIKYRPYAFTEYGAVMAANVLKSKRAIQASIYVVRAFVKLRQFVASHRELAHKLDELERNVATHDKAICSLFDAMRKLMSYPEQPHHFNSYIVCRPSYVETAMDDGRNTTDDLQKSTFNNFNNLSRK